MDVTTLTTEELAQGVADGTILVIDVREPPEFAAGHIPGSVLMPLSQFDPASIPAPAGQRIVFSCAAGVRSLRRWNSRNRRVSICMNTMPAVSGGGSCQAGRSKPVDPGRALVNSVNLKQVARNAADSRHDNRRADASWA